MTKEKLQQMRQEARALAEKTSNECDEHAKQVLGDGEEYEAYRDLVATMAGSLAMLAIVGKTNIFAEALATMNRIMADAERGEREWNEANKS